MSLNDKETVGLDSRANEMLRGLNNQFKADKFAEKYGNRPDDYYYASVGDILDYEDAVNSAVITETEIINNSNLTLYIKIDGEKVTISPKSSYKI